MPEIRPPVLIAVSANGVASFTDEFAGYHRFVDPDTGQYWGLFEVAEITTIEAKGWYWWYCDEKGIPEPKVSHGPFPQARGAYEDALGE
jgi:hypothetical protein